MGSFRDNGENIVLGQKSIYSASYCSGAVYAASKGKWSAIITFYVVGLGCFVLLVAAFLEENYQGR